MATQVDTEQCDELLIEACARNLPIELHRRTSSDELVVARSRILGLTDQNILIDTPQSGGRPLPIGKGRRLNVYFQTNNGQYEFQTQVTETRLRFDLNDEVKVLGCALRRPTSIQRGQRREDYRISLASLDEIAAELHEVADNKPDVCPLPSKRFRGRLVDISRGGVAVKVDASERRYFDQGQRFFLTATLPLGFRQVTLLVQLRHQRPILRGDATRLGMKFLFWNPEFTLPQIQTVGRFCPAVERRSIRKKR